MMRIDNAQLAAFAAALREGTFEAAARRLNVTPSAVSQRIKALEERMGRILIERTMPCRATAAGKPLWRYAEEVALLETEVLAELGIGQAIDAGALRIPIVVNADSLDSWFGAVFDALPRDGSLLLDIRTEDQDHSAALLRDGTVMAGVCASATPIQGCRVEPLGVMRYLALASPAYVGRHFAAGPTPEALGRAPMLMFNRKDALQATFLAQLTGAPLVPPVHFAPSTVSFLEVTRRGAAWGMIPEPMAGAALKSGELVEIAPGRWVDVPLTWHRWRIESTSLATISRFVHEAARGVLRQPPD